MKFKSALVTQVSGSIGGMTGSHNRGGLYFRARTIPVNTNTLQQQAVRGALANVATSWGSELTAGQRAGWNVYGDNVPIFNALGDPLFLSGVNHFVRSNVPRLQAGLPRVDDAPTVFNLGTFTQPALASLASPTTSTLSFDNGDDWANEDDSAMLVYVSRPAEASINFFAGPYRLAGSILGDSVTPPSSPAAIITPFPFATGNQVFFRVRVTRADGRLSSNFRFGGIGT